jgi:RNA polymerase sigma-70 factor (ECF subfamily)
MNGVKHSAIETDGGPSSGARSACAEVSFVNDAALVEGVRDGEAVAIGVFYERYRRRVWQVLHRVLGNDPELSDAHHEAFERALRSIGGLRDVTRLESWLIGVAVFTARSVIQRRVRRRWLLFMPPEKLPESAVAATGESSEAVRATSAVLEQLAADERIAFVLRFVEGMELEEAAEICQVSLSTFKRRLSRAEARFVELARDSAVLRDWLEGGSRWGRRER